MCDIIGIPLIHSKLITKNIIYLAPKSMPDLLILARSLL